MRALVLPIDRLVLERDLGRAGPNGGRVTHALRGSASKAAGIVVVIASRCRTTVAAQDVPNKSPCASLGLGRRGLLMVGYAWLTLGDVG